MFKWVSSIFAKTWFWLENIILVALYALYEIVILPLVFIKIMFTFLKIYSFKWFIIYGALWTTIGWIYLIIIALKDIVNFIRVLSDYKNENEEEDLKKQEEELQNKACLFNEVL